MDSDALIAPFVFSVYDTKLNRYPLKSSGIWRESCQGQPRFVMWIDEVPKHLPNIKSSKLLVEFRHAAGTYQDITTIRDDLGNSFCAFVQGVVIGWDTIEHNQLVAGTQRDEILVNRYLKNDSIEEFVRGIGLTQPGVRKLCREDTLFFAVNVYENHGSSHLLSPEEFIRSGFARMPYRNDIAETVSVDLINENKFHGDVGDTGDSMWRLNALQFEFEQDRVATRTRQWVDRLLSFGENLGGPEGSASKEYAVVRPTASARKKPIVFICYCKQDVSMATEIFEALQSHGAAPWLDKECLVHGDDWEREIKRAVEKADAFVACLRPGFDDIGYRQKEVRLALETLKLRPPDRGFIIPFLIEPCSLPEWCNSIHAGSDLSKPTTVVELIRAVRKHCNLHE